MVEPGLKNISHGRGKRERPNLGLPAALSGNRLPKATKGRGQPSAALSLGSVYLCTAKSAGGGCSLGPGAQRLHLKGTDRLWLFSLPSVIQTSQLLVNGILPG